MRLRHIEVFHAVYVAGSITGAAKLLNVSQPSVSKVLAHAEQQLGFPLFDRVKGKVIPTQEAERLISNAIDAYDNISELRRISENLRSSNTGLIRIAMTPAFGIDLVPAAIASYMDQHPQICFEIETLYYQQAVRALKQSRVDIGIVFDSKAVQGISVEHLAITECVVLAHKSVDFGDKHHLTLKDLNGMPFINMNARSPLGSLLASRMEADKIQFKNVAQVETYQMAKALVANGAGVAIVDKITAQSTGHNDVIVWELRPRLQFNISLMHVENQPLSVLALRFIEHLKTSTKTFLARPCN